MSVGVSVSATAGSSSSACRVGKNNKNLPAVFLSVVKAVLGLCF